MYLLNCLFYYSENERSRRFNWEKGTSDTFLYLFLSLLSTKVALGYLVVSCLLHCVFWFSVSNKNAKLVNLFFVYFIGFVIRFIFVIKNLVSPDE